MSNMIYSPVGSVSFNNVVTPKSFKDDPNLPKKYTIKLIFEGEDAKKFRNALLELGKPAKLVDGKLEVNFNRSEKQKAPKIFDKDGKELSDFGAFLPKGTKARVAFVPYTYVGGTALILEAIKVEELGASAGSANKSAVDVSGIDQAFLDAFM